MSKNLINRSKNTISATAHLPYGAYKALVQLATDHGAEIGKTVKGFLTVTFDEVKTAENVATRFRADYAEAHKAYVNAHTTEPAQEAKPQKSNGGKGKSKSFDFNSVKGNTNKEKNKALHAILVSMGYADSRVPEYQAVWANRPWAK